MGHAVSKSKPRKRPPLLRATALKGSLDAPSCPSPPGDSLAEGGSGHSSRQQDGNAAAMAAVAPEAAVVPVAAVALPAAILAKEKLLRVS